ncbi:SpoIIE family protein phosphatase [Calidifontibacter sp. DB0510]|uniref:SpoIIE family protein phosphatase n=1 Tax=Metallococcus carri TaxID=1656884 RepID=A0A967B171_9MICO|nr:protein phosphatase 2C domain-containing protein [Metallococcus carri]NHN56167.1 SpoIIE family protein phosphatase [Metallococcus carri]NOP38782.1 SpoIIE family protein phosphatase [Calidifontibacter sp. DB2511S]
MPIALRYAARTNLGLGSKTRNEDSAYASPDLLILADGMGGHAAGDTASSTVVSELIKLDGESLGADEALQHLRDAVHRANDRLRSEMDSAPDTEGMGTTLIAFLRSGNKLALANIGDSRAYLVRDGVFTQLTKDHSFVQALLDDGRITEEEAEHHPNRSMVTRVLTGRPEDEPDLSLREVLPGDRLLLCSDGLSDYVAGSTIESIVTREGAPADIADRLIDIAVKASTRDNVTVVVADVVDGGDGLPGTPQIVGAAANRSLGDVHDDDTQEQPQGPRTPAEKAAALSRQTTSRPQVPADDYVEEEEAPQPPLAEERPRRGGPWRWLGLILLIIAVLGVGAFVANSWLDKQYYVGDNNGKVAIFRGINQNLGPFSLHDVETTTDIPTGSLPPFYRTKVQQTISVKDKASAQKTLAQVRQAAAACAASPTTTPAGSCGS